MNTSCRLTALLFVPVLLAEVSLGHEVLIGAWDLTITTPQGEKPSWVKFSEAGTGAKVDFVGTSGGMTPAKKTVVSGDTAQWMMGDDIYYVVFKEGELKGALVRGEAELPLVGERVVRDVDVAGEWDLEAGAGRGVMTLEQSGDEVSGTYTTENGDELPITEIRLEGTQLIGSLVAGEAEVSFELSVAGDRIEGEASMGDREPGQVTGERFRSWGDPVHLFNGEDLSNWEFQEVGSANHWAAKDGVLVNSGAGWNLISKEKFKDYRLSLEVRVPKGGNSGIYLNGRYEVQVADSFGRPAGKSDIGAIYSRAVPTENAAKPAGEWQRFEITFVDYYATVVLNGKTIVDNVLIEGITGGALDSHESQPGPIMFQGDHGPIEYRNVVLTPIAD